MRGQARAARWAAISLSGEERQAMAAAISATAVEGERYAEHELGMVNP